MLPPAQLATAGPPVPPRAQCAAWPDAPSVSKAAAPAVSLAKPAWDIVPLDGGPAPARPQRAHLGEDTAAVLSAPSAAPAPCGSWLPGQKWPPLNSAPDND